MCICKYIVENDIDELSGTTVLDFRDNKQLSNRRGIDFRARICHPIVKLLIAV